MISLSVDILVFVIVVVLLILHYSLWQPKYKTELGDGKFDRKVWWNRQCEKEFRIKYAAEQYKKGRVTSK